jgi:hypothetical protein
MEIEEVRQKAREDAENLWKNELESLFSEKINESLLDLMKNIDSKFINYEKQLNASIKESNKNSMLESSSSQIPNKSISSSNISNNRVLNPKKIDITKINKMYVKLILSDDINPLINLIIQCLTNIKTFCAYYLNPKKEEKILSKSRKNPNGFYLGPAYLKLLKDIWGDQRGEYSPIEIHNILKKLMENDYNSNNSGCIMKFILNQLYLELNLDNNQLINLEHVKDLNNFPNNKILNASYPYIRTKKYCLSCKNLLDKYYIVSPVINIYLDANYGKSNKFNLENNLNDLLIERGKGKIIDNCFKCNRQQDIQIIKYISTPSEITIFHIDRKNDPNHNISLSYGFSMKLSKIEYKLITVIKCLPSYKDVYCPYIAYIRSFNNHNWYSYDNKDIKLCNNENEILEDKYASLLIYSPPKSN